MLIRKAEERDLEGLLDLYDRLYEILIGEYGYPFEFSRKDNQEVLSVQIRSKLCNVLVAEDNGALAGFVHASISKLDRRLSFKGQKSIGRIDDIFVINDVRGSGVAKMLIEKAEEWFREEEINFVESYILAGNERSMRFHEKNGFQTLTHRTYKAI